MTNHPSPTSYAHRSGEAAPHAPTIVRSRERDLILWLLIVAWGGVLGWLSILRYNGYNAGMLDLGNMAQAIASVWRGDPLIFTYQQGPTSRLAFHVELIYFLFAPFYAVWPDPRLLLIGQAGLFTLGALPVYRLALRRTESHFAARCLAICYVLYPTAQTSVLFDFHGDTLAMPLLLFAIEALDRRAWRTYAVWIALALACKFYVAAPVALMGLVIWQHYRAPRAALATAAAGIVYGAGAFFVVRPLFTTTATSEAHKGLNYIAFYFGQVDQLMQSLDQRLLSAIVVLGPMLLIAWRGWRWLIPALPIAAAALLSTGPGGAYDYRYHHYAIVVPFVIMASIDGISRMRDRQQLASRGPRRRQRSWRGDLGLTTGIVLICGTLLVDNPLNPLFWAGLPGRGLDPSVYGVTPRDRIKDAFLATHVPPEADLAASTFLAPHLVNRETLYLVRYPDEPRAERLPDILPQIDYAVVDALFDYYVPVDGGYGGGIDYDRDAIEQLLRDPAFSLVAMRDGLLVFAREAAPEAALMNRVITHSDDASPAEQQFGDRVQLVRHSIEQIAPRRLRARFTWRLSAPLDPGERFVAVSRLEGIDHARFVHLPTYVLLPVWEWPAGTLIEESFDVILPEEAAPGTYTWRTGWYDIRTPTAHATGSRSLIEGSNDIALEQLNIR